jgi:hypothetical protein
MNLNRNININKTISINEIILNLKEKNYKFDKNVCPNEITLEMLMIEMDCGDLQMIQNPNKNQLWQAYYKVMFCDNMFGFYLNETDANNETNENVKIPYVILQKK